MTQHQKIRLSPEKIELAHQKKNFLAREAIQFDLLLNFGGKERLNATVQVSTNSDSGSYHDEKWRTNIRESLEYFCITNFGFFEINTLRCIYMRIFFMLPYKLNDPGTKWSEFNPSPSEKGFDAGKLTFGANIGDAPDDWYVVFADKEKHLLQHASYIVTANKSLEKAESDPHAIQYLDYENIDGIPIARSWNFFGWKADSGLTNKLGNAKISNVKFIEGFKKNFKIPEEFIEVVQ